MATEEKASLVVVVEEEEDEEEADDGFVAERVVSNAPHGWGDSAKTYGKCLCQNYEVLRTDNA
jgi:hypothetical protein